MKILSRIFWVMTSCSLVESTIFLWEALLLCFEWKMDTVCFPKRRYVFMFRVTLCRSL
jgi:hypothetical protein